MPPKRSFPVRKMAEFDVCPGCGDGNDGRETMVTGVVQCTGCGAYVGKCYRGEALTLVSLDLPLVEGSDPAQHRVFHFTWIDTAEVIRGKFDRMTRQVVTYE